MLTMAVTAYLVIDNQLTAGVIIATSILVGKLHLLMLLLVFIKVGLP